ncbi:MAG: adenosylmethionine--8-amino-7-oxononanoate transaminase [Legionellales bacterium]|nr:adenosylmethionine--8-amino-7-oxononanoate transaminase [Legionellales bacterium]
MTTIENFEHLLGIDRDSIWHPYSAMHSNFPVYHVISAEGVRLNLSNGKQLVDGMSSWWCAIHGYNHPEINKALELQLKHTAHVMFGGLTHTPAIKLTEQLLSIVPDKFDAIFYSDSGSVAVEVAMKMAIQYWHAKGKPERQNFVSLQSGYHGDTFGAMSVCDPVTGMHSLFSKSLTKQFFIEQPKCRFGESCASADIAELKLTLEKNSQHIAALILEPIVQGAGGMWFYSADYLKEVNRLCKEFDVLLIFDEIATGFGRTGKLFAFEHAKVTPDIMCIGKALTGGYLSLAATITTSDIHKVIDEGEPGVFMHGPTFMANPLACSAALASTNLLLESSWQDAILRIEKSLENGLMPCIDMNQVADVRVLGGIGVVELKNEVDMQKVIPEFVKRGVWIRPFGKLVYLMPPYVTNEDDLNLLTKAIVEVVNI